jgi:hypothetical protein
MNTIATSVISKTTTSTTKFQSLSLVENRLILKCQDKPVNRNPLCRTGQSVHQKTQTKSNC